MHNDTPGTRTRDARHSTVDGRRVDGEGRIVPGTSGWQQHPQATRATRRLQPMPVDRAQMRDPRLGPDPYGHDEYGREVSDHRQPNVNVTVSNGGNFYRPWKEELMISGGRAVGNLIAAPFRLVWGLLGGVLRVALMAVIAPALIIGSISYYQSNQNKSGAEMAHDVGKAGVGLVGSALHGLWDGVFGSDDGAPAKAPADRDGGRDAPARR